MSGPESPTARPDTQRQTAERCTLPGHDRDVALAILNQSRLRGGIDDIQVAHLLAMGFQAGTRAGYRWAVEERTSWLTRIGRRLRRVLR